MLYNVGLELLQIIVIVFIKKINLLLTLQIIKNFLKKKKKRFKFIKVGHISHQNFNSIVT